MRSRSLTQVFSNPYFPFSSEAILRWFLPLYLDFCDVFDFDCSRERGCGFDDNCLFEEDCVVDVLSGPGRYRCQGRTAKPALLLPGQAHNADYLFSPVVGGCSELARVVAVGGEPNSGQAGDEGADPRVGGRQPADVQRDFELCGIGAGLAQHPVVLREGHGPLGDADHARAVDPVHRERLVQRAIPGTG